MLPEEHHNSQKERNPLLSRLLQAAMKVGGGWRATLSGFISTRMGNQGVLKAGTADVIDAVVQAPSSQLDPFDEFGFIPVKEPFVFIVDDEHVSVAMGAGGAVIAKIPVLTPAQAEDFILCLVAVLGYIANRKELHGEGAIFTFLGSGVCVEVNRWAVSIRVRLVKYTARTPGEMGQVVTTLNRLLTEVKAKAQFNQKRQAFCCVQGPPDFPVQG